MASSLIFCETEVKLLVPLRVLVRATDPSQFFIHRFGYSYLLTLVCQAIVLKSNLDCTTEQALLFRCDNDRLSEIITGRFPYQSEQDWLFNAFYQLRRYLQPQPDSLLNPDMIDVNVKGSVIVIEFFRARARRCER